MWTVQAVYVCICARMWVLNACLCIRAYMWVGRSVCVLHLIEKGREKQSERNERIDLESETGMEGELERHLIKGGTDIGKKVQANLTKLIQEAKKSRKLQVRVKMHRASDLQGSQLS